MMNATTELSSHQVYTPDGTTIYIDTRLLSTELGLSYSTSTARIKIN